MGAPSEHAHHGSTIVGADWLPWEACAKVITIYIFLDYMLLSKKKK